MSHGRLYQKRVKNAFDKKVRTRQFSEGDLMLKKVSQAMRDNRGKWAPNYEGPFVVKGAFSGGALVLTNMDSEELPSPVNSDVLLFLCVLLGFPLGFLSSVIFSSQFIKIKERGIEVPVLTLCFKICAVFDNLSLFA